MKNTFISKKYVKKILIPLLNHSDCLSNIAFNSKQRNDVPSDIRKSCEIYQKKYDLSRSDLPKWITK